MTEDTNHKSGYKKTAIGWIPNEWEIDTVSRAYEICNNLRFPISEEERKKINGIYPYYGPTRIQDYINTYRLDGKYALIGEDGDHFLKWRELPMTQLVVGKFNVNNHAHIIIGESNLTEWFFYYFNQRELSAYLTRQGAGRYKLTKASLGKIPIPLPPLPEQHAISEVLGCWDKAIGALSALIAQKQVCKKWLMQVLLTGKRRLPGFEGEWKRVMLGDAFDERVETGRGDLKLLSISGSLGVVDRDSIEKRDSSNEDKSKYRRIAPGDIGYNTMRLWQGVASLSSLEGIVSPAYTIIVPRDSVDGLYMSYLFKTDFMINKFYAHSQGLVDDTKNCKYPHFAEIKAVIPSKMEQIHIAKVLNLSDQEILRLESHLAALKLQKKGLMQELLTGRKRVLEGLKSIVE